MSFSCGDPVLYQAPLWTKLDRLKKYDSTTLSLFLRSQMSISGKFRLHSRTALTCIESLELSTQFEIRSGLRNTSVNCLDLDKQECKYLLCGGNNGTISLLDLTPFDDPCYYSYDRNTSKSSSSSGTYDNNTNDSTRVANVMHTSINTRNMHGDSRHRHLGHSGLISGIEWFPEDSGVFVSSSYDGRVLLWDTNSFQVAFEFDLSLKDTLSVSETSSDVKVTCSKIHTYSDHALVAAGLSNGVIKLCDTRTGDSMIGIYGYKEGINCLEWNSNNHHHITAASADGTIKTWDIRYTGSDLTGSVPLLCFDWMGDHTTFGEYDESSNDPKKRFKADRSMEELSKGHEGSVMSIQQTSCGNYLVTSGSDGIIRLWDKVLGKIQAMNYNPFNNNRVFLNSQTTSSDRNQKSVLPYRMGLVNIHGGTASDDILFIPSPLNGNIAAMNIHSSGRSGDTIKVLKGHMKPVTSIVYRPDHKQLISAGKDSMVFLWDSKRKENNEIDRQGSDQPIVLNVSGNFDNWSDNE